MEIHREQVELRDKEKKSPTLKHLLKNQLLEVYKMTPEVFSIIENNCIIDPSFCRKMNINSGTAVEFQAHPYLDWSQANSIVKMRQQKIWYRNVNELLESHLIDENTFLKLLPYLSL